jgi:hypothetical protein
MRKKKKNLKATDHAEKVGTDSENDIKMDLGKLRW